MREALLLSYNIWYTILGKSLTQGESGISIARGCVMILIPFLRASIWIIIGGGMSILAAGLGNTSHIPYIFVGALVLFLLNGIWNSIRDRQKLAKAQYITNIVDSNIAVLQRAIATEGWLKNMLVAKQSFFMNQAGRIEYQKFFELLKGYADGTISAQAVTQELDKLVQPHRNDQ